MYFTSGDADQRGSDDGGASLRICVAGLSSRTTPRAFHGHLSAKDRHADVTVADDRPLGAIMDFHFQIIKLWEEPVEQWLASGQIGLLPFTPLLQGATLATLDTVVPFLEHIPDDAERSSALNFLLLFATRAFGIEAINDYLRRHAMKTSYPQLSKSA